MSSNRQNGRIRPHQRDAEDNVDILGSGIAVQAAHQAAVRETELRTKELATKRDKCGAASIQQILRALSIVSKAMIPKMMGAHTATVPSWPRCLPNTKSLFVRTSGRIEQTPMNSHGIRKGAATTASSATTCPPPVSSIAARGEWSLGGVLDLYWHFSALAQ
jgi:hypothetical protein